MAKRGGSRRKAVAREPAVIAQANPTPEQRARSVYVVAETVDPYGETVVQGKVRTHKVCRRQPLYVTLVSRGRLDEQTRRVLDWYADRHALAIKGLTVDSLARSDSRGGGDLSPSEAAMQARDDVAWAKSHIGASERPIFEAVMEREETFAEIGRGNRRREALASTQFRLAASQLLLRIGHCVLSS